MKFVLSLIGITILSISLLYAQDCGSNATHADALRESQRSYLRSNQRVSKISATPLRFTLKFHIVTESDGTGAPDYNLVKESFDTLSKKFAKINVVFDTCSGSSYINNSEFFIFDDSSQQNQIASFYDSANVINVYIVGDLWYGRSHLCGIVSQINASLSTNRLFVSQQCLSYNTLTHEMGHYFGLYHTFETYFGVEDPKESNCTTAGDLLCDTPADPNGNVYSNCQYAGPFTELYGGVSEPLHPLVNNIMSYYKVLGKECRTAFTADQYAVMYDWALENQGKYICPPPPPLTIKLFPVPTANILTVKAIEAYFPLELRIIDVTGRIHYTNTLVSPISELNISSLEPGMYIVQVIGNDNKSLLRTKIIKSGANP